MSACTQRLARLQQQAREAEHITIHLDKDGGAFCAFGGTRFALHSADAIDVVKDVIIERLHDPDAPKVATTGRE